MAKSNGIDLSKLSLEELQALARDVETEVVTRRAAEKERVLNQIRELAGSLGMTPEELLREERGGSSAVAPKYRHPDNPGLTWSGRGKRPTWINEALASGKTLDDLAIS
jgi:DNA-binding protein H-NS